MILGGDMNKQIQDLFMRSGGSIAMIDGEMLTFTDHFDPEKFAKLIVQECAKMVDDDGDAVMALRILNRFGVDN